MDRCTRAEALRILRVIVAPIGDPAVPPADIAKNVARLQTLSDDDLTVLSQSEQTFALIESNRRLSAPPVPMCSETSAFGNLESKGRIHSCQQ
jgi:hypothetical protein